MDQDEQRTALLIMDLAAKVLMALFKTVVAVIGIVAGVNILEEQGLATLFFLIATIFCGWLIRKEW